MKAEIWMICSEICLEIFSVAECMEAKGRWISRMRATEGCKRRRPARGDSGNFEEVVFDVIKTFTQRSGIVRAFLRVCRFIFLRGLIRVRVSRLGACECQG